MKNTNLKLNKTKLVARLMLVVIWGLIIFNLFACSSFGDVDWVVHYRAFNTHLEFANFIQDYNSQGSRDMSSFISLSIKPAIASARSVI